MIARTTRLTAVVLAFWIAHADRAQPAGPAPAGGTSDRVIPIVVAPEAPPVERASAGELAAYLRQLYPGERFAIAEQLPDTGRAILVGDAKTDPRVRGFVPSARLSEPESYLVTTASNGRRHLGVIAGADARGVVYGVYGLLEKLGCGFYLSGDALPPPDRKPLALDDWQLADRPLVRERLVFDWHNFLSGCSTWNLPQWKAWILQSQKQGYNAVMVHAYGNNPMVSFAFDGKQKPVGYLSTTAKGRDWSTMHVNDVRRLWGGEVFDQPVFGCDAALVPDEQRAEAARKLMQEVFAYAAERAMGVVFATDVDTISANPQDLIQTLPPEARFATTVENHPFWLANPDTPQGYRYYKAQVEALLTAYPQITTLVVWFRNGKTPWMDLKVTQLPPLWQQQYQAAIAAGASTELRKSQSLFAIGKIVEAFDRALKDLGHERVRLATGTWNFAFVPAADRFLPRHVELIGLDYGVLHDDSQLGTAAHRQLLAEVGAHRDLLPVIWAQHDDGNYVGRPYTPFAQFYTTLTEAKACGFGIIHWTTCPLDLFFASHAKQVWQRSQNQPLRVTCDAMAARMFGMERREKMGEYFERWVTDAPKFARETGDRFIDRELTDIAGVAGGCRARIDLIESAAAGQLSPAQHDRLNYARGLEEFIAAIYQTQGKFQDAEKLAKQGRRESARTILAECRPEEVIEQFAKSSRLGGITRGEQGLVVTMNTRWLPHYVRLRQSLGMEAVRYKFGPTSHDPLAQAPGRFTFFFDAQRHLWQTLGAAETGAAAFVLPGEIQPAPSPAATAGSAELCRSGIESDQPITLALQPILRKAALPPGNYRLRLWMLDPTSSASGQRVFSVAISGSAHRRGATPAPVERIDIFHETAGANTILERSYPVVVGSAGEVQLTLTPVVGKAVLCAAVLEPGPP